MKKNIKNIICRVLSATLFLPAMISVLPQTSASAAAALPTVITDAVSYVTMNEAELTGYVTDNGGSEIIRKGFVYWNKLTPDNRITEYTTDINSTETSMKFELTGLDADNTYYYYAFAENVSGVGKGHILSFATSGGEPRPEALVISPGYTRIAPGEEYTLNVSALPATVSGYDLSWSSSDPDIVTVDETGTVIGISEGDAVITASTDFGRARADCIVEVKKPAEIAELDFSEWNMITNVSSFAGDGFGYDWDATFGGGSYLQATAYLARWDGAVLESRDKYPEYYTENADELYSMYKELDADYHVQNIDWLPPRESPTDNDRIKEAVMENGAVYGLMQVDMDCFTNGLSNYYCSSADVDSGHGIAIVGWDDNYPASSFISDSEPDGAPGDGAFICKNSWGINDTDDGFFYLSYYDALFSRIDYNAVVTGVEKNSNYNTIFQYDTLGMTSYIYYGDTVYSANVFPEQNKVLSRSELLRAVSFYTLSENVRYEVFIVTDFNGEDDLEKLGTAVAKGTMQRIGYHTVSLDFPIALEAGTRFAVVVRLEMPNDYAFAAIEEPIEDYSSAARANQGESYMSADGSYWEDLTSFCENSNCCIKAFTDNGLDTDALYQAIDNANRTYNSDSVVSFETAIAQDTISEAYLDHAYRVSELSIASDEGRSSGAVPGFVKLNTTGAGLAISGDNTDFPDHYDLRDFGLVSSVKDQGRWGTCWSFAMYSSLESCDMRNQMEGRGMYAEAASLTLSRSELTLRSGSTFTLSARLSPANAAGENSISWAVSDSDKITIDRNGTIRLNDGAYGTALITAVAVNGTEVYTADCTVLIETEFTLETHKVKKRIGDRFMLAYYFPRATDTDDIEWVSDDPNVAVVDSNGVITATGNGKTEITLRSQDGTAIDTFTIIVDNEMNYALSGCDISDLTFSAADHTLSGSAKITLNGNTTEAQDAIIYLTVCSPEGALAGTVSGSMTLEPGINEIVLSDINISVSSPDYTIKCFVWSDYNTMIPLAKKVELVLSNKVEADLQP